MLTALLLPFVLIFAFSLVWYIFIPRRHEAGQPADAVQKGLRWTGVFCLLMGLSAAAYIYRVSPPNAALSEGDIASYQFEGGVVTPVPADDDKKYLLQMRKEYGKAGLLIADAESWLAHHLQGRNRAYTLAAISLLAFLACFFLARFL